MENTNIYHFNVPNTKLTYTVRLRYEGDFLRSFEVSNLIEGNRNNHKLDNVELLCYNCYYVNIGSELIGIKKRKYWTPDYFRKYHEEDYHKHNDYEYDDFDLDKVTKEDFIEQRKKDDEIDELFKQLNK